MNHWEYKWFIVRRAYSFGELTDWKGKTADGTVIEGRHAVEVHLNELGEQGWELVSSIGEHWGEKVWMCDIHFLFKRVRSSPC